MTSSTANRTLLMVVLVSTVVVAIAPVQAKIIGKNPGKIAGRWLDVENPAALDAYKGVYLGEVTANIEWKKEENEQPIEEEILAENFHDQLLERLSESSALGQVLAKKPADGEQGYLKLDCHVEVEPGSRAARWAVGLGAGKSRSIIEIHIKDHATGEQLGLYHGHGIGSGAGFKIGGGGARKMTQDDIQENTKQFVELLNEIR